MCNASAMVELGGADYPLGGGWTVVLSGVVGGCVYQLVPRPLQAERRC